MFLAIPGHWVQRERHGYPASLQPDQMTQLETSAPPPNQGSATPRAGTCSSRSRVGNQEHDFGALSRSVLG